MLRPPLGLVDSHCHLQQLHATDRDAALDRARRRGVEGFLVPALHLDEAEELFALAERHDDVWCAVGVHPHEAKRWRDRDQERLDELLSHPRVVAVGECGLDFHYDLSPREAQLRVLTEQLEVARARQLPVIVHSRDSNQEMTALFGRAEHGRVRAVFHSYCSGPELARFVLGRGGFLGISGMVTFPKAENVREVLPMVPKGRLLVETDTPYLAPVPHRGKPNEPAYVVEVAQRVAEALDLTFDELNRRTGEAFVDLFPRVLAAA